MNSYYIVLIKGKNINKFLHKCINNNINILNIKYISHKEIIIKININDYNKLQKIKSIYKIKIINKQGILKVKQLLNINKILLISIFIGIIFLVLLTNTIFKIEIICDNEELISKVDKILIQNDIKKYHFKKSYKYIQNLKKQIKEEYKDQIEWIEISSIGTKYEVKIVERKIPKIRNDENYVNIVARKSGIIRKIYAEKGQKQVELNTYVNKGDTIISGVITKGEDIKENVHAKGKVYAEIWYNVSVEYPLKYQEKVYTNKKCKRMYIKLSNKYIRLKKYKNFESKKIHFLKSSVVPFEIGIEEEKEIIIINDKYTSKEAKIKALLKAKEKVLQTLDKDEYIINEKPLKFKEKNSKIVLEIFFSCYEEIGIEEMFIPEEEKE